MKWVLIFWGAPIAFLGSWYWLSYYDISFGYFMLTRQANELVFQVYGEILGLPPEIIPGLVFDVILFDSAVVFGLMALRRHRAILSAVRRAIAWWRSRQSATRRMQADRGLKVSAEMPIYPVHPAE